MKSHFSSSTIFLFVLNNSLCFPDFELWYICEPAELLHVRNVRAMVFIKSESFNVSKSYTTCMFEIFSGFTEAIIYLHLLFSNWGGTHTVGKYMVGILKTYGLLWGCITKPEIQIYAFPTGKTPIHFCELELFWYHRS